MAAVTKGGKSFDIRMVNGKALYEVVFTSGGRLPKELHGLFTGRTDAENAIEAYLKRSKK